LHYLALPIAVLAVAGVAAASQADALAIDAAIQARHVPFGTIIDPVFSAPASSQITTYTRCGDSATWTGHYLAAEAFRYSVTRSPDALANIKGALAGLKSLVDVTGTNLLARCAVPMSSPYFASISGEEQHNGIHINSALGTYWVGNTSRDQYSGAFFGLAIAFDMVDDASVRTSVSDLVTRMLDFLIGHFWIVVMPDGTPSTTFLGRADQQLSLLQVGRHVNPSKYSSVYDSNQIALGGAVLLPIALEVQSDSSYFKFNLDYINFYNLIRLETSTSLRAAFLPAYAALRQHTQGHQNPFFNMIDQALSGSNQDRDTNTQAMLDQWLQRPRRDPYVDLRGKLPSCGSPDEACNPVPVAQRPTTDFLWQRDPFQLDGGGGGTVEGAGIDYLLPYWMTRFYETANAAAVLSAASGTTTVAPESIASIYGTNLLGTPPSTGGGITGAILSLRVRDSAGIERDSVVFYLSSNQINFQIPPGTALGEATVTRYGSAGTAVLGTAIVQNVSPGIFTADGSGKGVPAALLTRVFIPTQQQSTFPIFQCANNVCTAIPFNGGIDTPTYLILFGTGIRNRSSLSNVTVTINGMSAPVLYAGAQGFYTGLDQVNLAISPGFHGLGEVDLVLTVDGQAANTVRVNIQ